MAYDYESGDQPLFRDEYAFSEKSIRHGFIRKVYLILTGQLLVTFGAIALFVLNEGVMKYVANNIWMFWTAFVTSLVCVLALSCCGSLRRKFPQNFIFLGIFTLAQAFLLGCISASYSVTEVLVAVGITFVIVLSLTIFAFQTKIDFTMCSGFVLVSLICLFMFGILAAIFQSKVLSMLYASIGALLFSFYLVFDTQLIMGGNHKMSISPEEYIFAALQLYLDIVQIFIYILQLVGSDR